MFSTMKRIICGVFLLILQINLIKTDCERINEDNRPRVKCYYSTIEEINRIQNSDGYTELEIVNGKLLVVGKNAFNYTKLSSLKIIQAGIKTVQSDTFNNLPSLVYLDLSHNQLTTLPSKMFQNNLQLRILNISSNSISTIFRDTFIGLPDLIELNLNSNKLTVIKNIFSSLTQLVELNLVGNKISDIEPATFQENVNLKKIFLNWNPLSNLKENTFQADTYGISATYVPFQSNPSSIVELHLGQCEFKSLKNYYFVNLRRLKHLNLRANDISDFESGDVFKENIRIEYLSLSYNRIMSLPETIFQKLRNLQLLTLHQNQLVDLPANLFKRNSKLKDLSLSYNQIAKLDSQVFKYLRELLILNLEGNLLTTVPKDIFEHLGNLKELFLTRNEITYIEPGSFDNLIHLKSLKLYQNSIKVLEPNVLFKLTELNTLSLSANGISDIQMGAFNGYHDGYADETSRLLLLDLSGSNITHLRYNLFAPLSRLISLDVSYCHVNTLDIDFFKSMGGSLTILKMSANQLTELEVGVFDYLENLISLSLNRNLLTKLDDQLFQYMVSLEKLDLSANKFKFIPPNLLNIPNLLEVNFDNNEITHLAPNIFEGEDCVVERFLIYNNMLTYLDKDFLQKSKLKFIRFGKNPWQCGCLNEVMNEIYRLNIDIERIDYLDGTNPICVVTPNNTCIHETHLTPDLYKKYTSINHTNVIRW